MVVMDMLYHAPKNYEPGQLHTLKITVVNAHFLAFVCLRCFLEVEALMPNVSDTGTANLGQEIHRIYLWQCLLHSSTFVLDAQQVTMYQYGKFGSVIEDELQKGKVFPWAALTRLQAPKYFSDIIEAVIGAVYLDSHGSFDAVRQVLRKLGILPVLERIIEEDVDVLHPISRMSIWAAKQKKEIEYKLTKANGKIHCAVLFGKEKLKIAEFEDIYRGKRSENDVKFQAAEDAYKFLLPHDGTSSS
jgi:endoribonuclease Dicer